VRIRVAFIITGLLGISLAAVGLLSPTRTDSVVGLIVTACAVIGYTTTGLRRWLRWRR